MKYKFDKQLDHQQYFWDEPGICPEERFHNYKPEEQFHNYKYKPGIYPEERFHNYKHKPEKFACCPHGSAPENCPTCQRISLLLVFKHAKLPELPKDIRKMIASILPVESDMICCSRCIIRKCKITYRDGHRADRIDGEICFGNGIYTRESKVYTSGGYDSDFDDSLGYFMSAGNVNCIKFTAFVSQYFTKHHKMNEDKLQGLHLCTICIKDMIRNRELKGD